MGDEVKAPFSWLPFVAGLLLTLIIGLVANVLALFVASSVSSAVGSSLIGAVPGIGFMLLSRGDANVGFGRGLLVGGCVLAMIGGVCGANLSGGRTW